MAEQDSDVVTVPGEGLGSRAHGHGGSSWIVGQIAIVTRRRGVIEGDPQTWRTVPANPLLTAYVKGGTPTDA
jgi:hypothetical protein